MEKDAALGRGRRLFPNHPKPAGSEEMIVKRGRPSRDDRAK